MRGNVPLLEDIIEFWDLTYEVFKLEDEVLDLMVDDIYFCIGLVVWDTNRSKGPQPKRRKSCVYLY
jgi:hypothetical protein